MARGAPDFGMYAAKEVSASISDMGEVAARLGSIVIYDKRGDVVDFDTFEEPLLKWQKEEDEGSVYFHSVDARSGSQSVALSTDAGIGKSVWIKKFLNVTPSKRLGIEFSFGSELNGFLYMLPIYYDSKYEYRPYVKIDFANHLIYVWDVDVGDYSLVGNTGVFWFALGYHYFYTLKLVCDFGTGEFVRLMLGRHEWDISAFKMDIRELPAAPHLEVDIGRENTTVPARITSIDDFIFTQAEP